MKKAFVRFLLVVLSIMMIASSASCKLTEDVELTGLKVVMTSKNVDMTMYDFAQSYRTNDYYQYMVYGLIAQDQYCEYVINDVSNFMYILNAAYDAGIELTQEEYDEINERISSQLEEILQSYEQQVPAGAKDVRAEAIKLLEADIADEGIDYNSLVELSTKNLCMYKIAEKYYSQLTDSVTVTDDEVSAYINELFFTQRTNSISDAVAMLTDYYSGNGSCPAFIPENCFSVNHLYLALSTVESAGDTPVYDKNSRKDDEAVIEAALSDAEGFDGFMALVEQYGEDPGMTKELFKENGYVIHPSLDSEYFPGFVYAAMNLHDGEWSPAADADYEIPELTFFELKDGTNIVKVYTESGVHYIIINKEYRKGRVQYEVGDKKWEGWKSELLNKRLDDMFTELSNTWRANYPIDIDRDMILAKFVNTEAE